MFDKIIEKIEEGFEEVLKNEDTYEFLKETLEKSTSIFQKNTVKKLEKKRKKLLKKKHVVYIKYTENKKGGKK